MPHLRIIEKLFGRKNRLISFEVALSLSFEVAKRTSKVVLIVGQMSVPAAYYYFDIRGCKKIIFPKSSIYYKQVFFSYFKYLTNVSTDRLSRYFM